MGRRRLGVVLLVPPPLDREIDGLRRGLGDGALGRIAPHLTIVPPVNVREDRLGDALGLLRRAAAATTPITLTLGPPATFLPAAPVVQLPVTGEERAMGALLRLRTTVFVEPLARPLTHPFVPHVTVADELEEPRIGAGLAALADYVVEATFAAVHLLEEGPGRTWRPIADAPFSAPAVVARGPMQVELTVTGLVDPEAGALVDREWPAGPDVPSLDSEGEQHRTPVAGLVVTARRADEVVGVAVGTVEGSEARLSRLVVAGAERGTGVGAHLLDRFCSAAAGRGCRRATAVLPPGGTGVALLRGRGWVEESGPSADAVRLVRWL